MAEFLRIKFDKRGFKDKNKAVETASRRASRLAINETISKGRSVAVKEVAQQVGLPQNIIRNRYSSKLSEGKKVKIGQRIRLKKASYSALRGTIRVFLRGIPVTVVAGAQVRGAKSGTKAALGRGSTAFGVKVTGAKTKRARFYPGAFKDRSGRVWKRQDSGRLMVPKIGVREDLLDEFDEYILSGRGKRRYEQVYKRILKAKLKRVNRGR